MLLLLNKFTFINKINPALLRPTMQQFITAD
jgi:hypothetical protein